MRKGLLLTFLSAMITVLAFSQDNYWSRNNENRNAMAKDKAVARLSFPTEYRLFNLNIAPLRQQLFSVVDKQSKQSTIISVPNVDGTLEQFEVFEASNFEPALQAKFPEIRAYSGRGITDRSATLKLSISSQGIQTMVFRSGKENEFIEAYSADHIVYAVFRSQRAAGGLKWNCSTPDEQLATSLNNQVNNYVARSGGNLKTLRLAQSCNAEYSNWFGAFNSSQVGLVLAAFNATLTRCNGVYEKDLALHLNLVASSTNVIYYSPSTDPYTTLSSWNSQLQNALNTTLTGPGTSLAANNAAYDIGHMFGASGGGGNAGCIGCVCVDGVSGGGGSTKGRGITSPADGIPQGDNFDIDYVVHEVGHQLGANHTFSMSNEGTGVNKEVGSGITIMGYAGITNQDVAPHSIDIFHQASIAQIQANINTKSCPVTTTIANATPVVNAGSDYTIPISTPFALTGSATDADATDVLTYCWEQNDNASSSQTGSSSVASATKATGPNWISFKGTTSPTRLFPKLSTILAGQNISGPLPGGDGGANTEALSSISRTLNFRLTVSDNAPYSSSAPVSVGQTQFDDVVITVTNTSGPFAVTAPNTAVSWTGNSAQTVIWSVNNTTAAPVSCANVKISISTDGGNTFSTLIASTPNDGSEVINVPNTPSTTARIKVEAVGNIFFDISNTNFTIVAGSSCGTPTGLSASSITNTSATVSWTGVGGALSYDVDYKAASSGTWINAATGTTSTSADLTGLTEGTLYDYRVRTNCESESSIYAQAQFTTTAPCNPPTGLSSSAITSSSATVSWTGVGGANNYTVEYKQASSGTWITAAGATTSISVNLSGLAASTLYDWRVRANCASGSSAYSQAQFTTSVAPPACPGPLDIEPNGNSSQAQVIPLNTLINGTLGFKSDNDYYRLNIITGGAITITLTTLPANYDLSLLASNGTTVLATSATNGNETISANVTSNTTYYVRVYPRNNGAWNATSCYTLNVGSSTATRGGDGSITSNRVSIFPNPASGVLNVSVDDLQTNATLQVYDVMGKLVMQQQTNKNVTALNVSKLPSGIYMINIKATEGTRSIKFVKE
jgi:hypothetical protein